MKIRVNCGTLSKRSSPVSPKDGFSFLFPGIYEAELTVNHELIFQQSATQKIYLPITSILEKVQSGVITFIEINDFDKNQSTYSTLLYK
jgi:hypothetical protein